MRLTRIYDSILIKGRPSRCIVHDISGINTKWCLIPHTHTPRAERRIIWKSNKSICVVTESYEVSRISESYATAWRICVLTEIKIRKYLVSEGQRGRTVTPIFGIRSIQTFFFDDNLFLKMISTERLEWSEVMLRRKGEQVEDHCVPKQESLISHATCVQL